MLLATKLTICAVLVTQISIVHGIFYSLKLNDTSTVGVLQEHCDDEEFKAEKLQSYINSMDVPTFFWKMGCADYIAMANLMKAINSSGISRLLVMARRETLRFAESLLERSNVLETVAIPTNNNLMVGGQTQSRKQRRQCKDRAGGKQFWGLSMALLADIIDHWQWRNLYLYVDEVYGLAESKQVHEGFKNYQKVASLKMIRTALKTSPAEFVNSIAQFERGVKEVRAIIVICSKETTKEIAFLASKQRLFSTWYRWLIFDEGSEEVLRNLKMQFDTDVILMRHSDQKIATSSAIAALEKFAIKNEPKGGPVTAAQAKMTEARSCHSDDFTTTSAQFLGKRSKIVGKEYLPQDVQLEFLRASQRVKGIPKLITIAHWTATGGLTNMKNEIADLDGFTLQVVALHCPPYVFVEQTLDGKPVFKGYLVDVLAALGRIMNFKFNITVPFDHTYGRCEGKICTGVIGILVRKEAHLALANLTPTGSRVKLMDFSTIPVDKAGLSMLLKRPTKTDSNIIKAYIMPFSWDVSVCVAVSIPLIGCLLHVALKISSKAMVGSKEEAIDNELMQLEPQAVNDNRSLGRCLFAAVQSFGQQGIDIVPNRGSGRVVFGVMWLFSLFIMSSYTANLISYFTATFVSWPFKDLEEVFKSKSYKIGFLKGTTYLDDMQGDNTTILMKIWKSMEKQRFSTMVDNLDEGVERVRSERYILVHEARVLQYITGRDCEFATINERYLSAPMMLAFQKESQFRGPISNMLLKITESGLLERLKNKWWPPTYDCAIASQTFNSISLWGTASILGILASGIFVSCSVMLLEKGVAAQKLRARLRALADAIPDNLNIHIPVNARLATLGLRQRLSVAISGNRATEEEKRAEEEEKRAEEDAKAQVAPLDDVSSREDQ